MENKYKIKDLKSWIDSLFKYDQLIISYNNGLSTIDMLISDLPYCCGASEIGNFRMTGYSDFSSDHIDAISELFTEIAKRHNDLIINTNGYGTCVFLEKVLEKNNNWLLVKTFINPSSGNTIKMWINKITK